MNITLKRIDKDNWHQAIELKTGEDHKQNVADNLYSIAESHYTPGVDPYGIYDGETMVGFAMFGQDEEDREENILSLWRFMIGNNHRCKGYGKAGMGLIIDIAKKMDVDSLFLSTAPANYKATALYTGVGFQSTGEIDDGEEVFVLHFKGQQVKKEESAKDPEIANLSDDQLNQFCSLYLDRKNNLFREIYLKEGKLFYSRGDDHHSPLQPVSDSKLIMNMSSELALNFSFEDGNKSFQFFSGDEKISSFVGYQPINLDQKERGEFLGLYHSELLETTYNIISKDQKMILTIGSKVVSTLTPISDGSLLVDEWGNFFTFDRDENGDITALKSDEERAKGLIFRKVIEE